MSRIVATLLLAVLVGFSTHAATPVAAQTDDVARWTFPPNEMVYPEGVAYHAGNGDFFVSSTANGAIYRGNAWGDDRSLQVFLPGGADGRTAATGMKVNPQGQLFISGGATGMVWMYDAVTGRLLSSFSNGYQSTFINDVTIAPDGAAYFTDSLNPVIYRIAPDADGVFQFSFWRDLRGTALEYIAGFNLNGIAITEDGKYLIAVQSNTGKLWRIATADGAVSEIPLAGGDRMTSGDGILVMGQTLYVARNSLNLIVAVRLAPDFASGKQIGSFTNAAFQYSTTIAQAGNRLLVVNSQFDRRATNNPELPFSVVGVPMP